MMQRTIDQWLDAYGVSHRHPINKLIHWICVPVIVWTVLALLWGAALPGQPLLNLASLLIVVAMGFYWYLSPKLALGMLVYSAVNVALLLWHQQAVAFPLWQTALALFVIAWIGQFIGHLLEGAKPSFFEDIQFLLIGPIWLLSFLYRKAGIDYRPHRA